jgi:tetratricopeptide (TPR) repeat protein
MADKMKQAMIFAAVILLAACERQASIREEMMEAVTYPFGDPDPAAHPESSVYPYFSYSGYSHQGKPEEWETVVLENEYIRVIVVPAIGGKIWAAVEKSTGKDFIYFNHAVKFRNISMRGPWTSGGIEMNFGIIGHAPTVATPVDYYTRTNEDGSVSCFVGAQELLSRTWWQVEINLPRDRACFTTTTTWHNGTAVSRPYYQWMNAAYHAADDLEFIFPGQYYIGHDGISYPWHTDSQGRDLSKYAVHTFGGDKSYHVLGNCNDFYAAYYRDSRFGSVHYSPFNDKLGMKIFIWGLSRQGMIWEDLLTDTDGQYVELQSGRLYNQAAPESQRTPFKQYAFAPYATDIWTEYWYPVKETGGIVKAGEYGALNVVKSHDSVTFAFSPVRKIREELVVMSGEREIYRKQLSLDVLQTWQATVPLDDPSLPLTVTLGNGCLSYSENPADNRLSRPVTSPPDADRNSLYSIYVQGEQEMNRNQYRTAEKHFRQTLVEDPLFIPAWKNLADIYYRQGRYGEADSCVRTVLSANTYDPGGNLLYGLISSRLGRPVDALDGYKVAALSPSYRGAAHTCLAMEAAKKQNWQQTLDDAERSLESGIRNVDALQLQAVAFRKLGKTEDASRVITRMKKELPLNHFVRFEKYLQSNSEKDKNEFLKYIRNELPHETFMELAGWYENTGCTEEALTLYAFVPDYPMALYRAASLMHRKGDMEYKTLLERAESLPVKQVFPFRTETLPVLEWAVKQSGKWVSKYYAGILYAFLGQEHKASALLEECGTVPDEASFYLTRAQYRQGLQKEEDLLLAGQLEDTWRAGMALVEYYQKTEQYAKMYETAQKYAALYPDNDMLGLKYALAMFLQKKYEECTEYLGRVKVLPNEGAYEGRRIYREAWMSQARQSVQCGQYDVALEQIERSKLWPENLGVGKPYDDAIDLREENALTDLCKAKLK